MSVIEIKNRGAEEVACWRVKVAELTPNTVIETDGKVTVLVKIGNQTKVQMRQSSTVFGLFNPGKNKKFFGGDKPYEKFEIYAIDQSSQYNAEWALAGSNAMTTIDPDFNVEASVIATGNYYYTISNFYSFITAMAVGERGAITRDDIREFLRQESTGIFKKILAPVLMRSTINDCKANAERFVEKIKEEINNRLESKGIGVESVVINKFAYTPDHELKRNRLKDAKINNAIGSEQNKGKRDDIGVDKEQAFVENIRETNALPKDVEAHAGKHDRADRDDKPVIICPRCGERNHGGNYCNKCGEKLNK
ncbi:MAG: SPFH domain-containing protein [Clostridia bacterium]|nr:SPFH domain-containing protein [Clostridia bacterium]